MPKRYENIPKHVLLNWLYPYQLSVATVESKQHVGGSSRYADISFGKCLFY